MSRSRKLSHVESPFGDESQFDSGEASGGTGREYEPQARGLKHQWRPNTEQVRHAVEEWIAMTLGEKRAMVDVYPNSHTEAAQYSVTDDHHLEPGLFSCVVQDWPAKKFYKKVQKAVQEGGIGREVFWNNIFICAKYEIPGSGELPGHFLCQVEHLEETRDGDDPIYVAVWGADPNAKTLQNVQRKVSSVHGKVYNMFRKK
ncbi:hypothetical protein T439DRAFT_336344 [Meredithblackwellia eburnea MCA 4105]